MLKRYMAILISGLMMFSFSYLYKSPVFNNQGTYEIYFGDSASQIYPVRIRYGEYYKYRNIKGESFTIDKSNFNLEEFINKYRLKLKATEKIEGGINYYCYSPLIKYRERVSGKIVNVHIHVDNEKVKIGTPIIYGSF